MRFCEKCGKELMDESIICLGCGCSVAQNKNNGTGGTDELAVAIKVFLILSCIFDGFMLLPLAWCLPITIAICGRMKRNEPVGVGLKVCALIFVSLIGGILLLCRSDDK